MPDHRVLSVQHPVILVRKIQKLARHALDLQHVEQLYPLADRQPVIEIAVDDEMRRRPVLIVQDRVPAIVGRRLVGGGEDASLVVVDEPQLFGGVVGQRVGDAIVGNESVESPPQRMALNPVHPKEAPAAMPRAVSTYGRF